MFTLSTKIINKGKNNHIIKKNISLDIELDCFIHIDSQSKNFSDAILNKIVDHIIDKISLTNTYSDFSIALENINAFIKTWNTDNPEKENANIIIGVLHKNNFIFSNIGQASAYLVNKNDEFIPLTDHHNQKNNFSYISNGELYQNEFIIISTTNILNYVSQSDIIDGINMQKNINQFCNNISQILDTEDIKENILFSSFQYYSENTEEISHNKYIQIIQEKWFQILDTSYMKKGMLLCIRSKDIFQKQSKTTKNIFFICIIALCIISVYSLLSNIISVSTQSEEKQEHISQLEQAKNFIRQASNNIANSNVFEKNIQDAEQIIHTVKGEKLFLSDIEKMQKNIHVLKKQFHKIETFDGNQNNLIYSGNFINFVKILKNKLKPYIIEKKSITGPINTGGNPKKYINTQLDNDEFFIDATLIGNDIYLSTNKSKVVRFSKTGHFSFVDVQGQSTWGEHKHIHSYNGNLYLTDKNSAQIYKHSYSGKYFTKAKPYLNADDSKAIKNILSIAIDGGFYILKDDLMIQKFFSSPKYEMVNIVMNNIPKSYIQEDISSKVELKTRSDLNYIYILLNNKIFVFQPNSRRYRDVNSITYIGQIEGGEEKIQDFYVNHDGELWVINKNGIYDLSFEISDNKLIMR